MSVTAPKGFVAAGVACGIKASGAPDLALVASAAGPVAAAGVFTDNRAAAAPVQVSRAHLSATGGRAVAVVLSSGNANAATGAPGVAGARRMCALVGEGLGASPDEVLVCQTGLIGIPLPMEPVERGIPALVAARAAGPSAAQAAATAIMTTDTMRKEVAVDAAGFTVGGMAKGAAMLAPNMATMLAVLTTDARCEPAALTDALREAVGGSFNRLSVDGCTSTNDTVLALASGASGTAPAPSVLADALAQACAELAGMMAADAEGATKLAHVVVTGAASDDEAHRAARKVAESQLVKCSLNGEDPYWGRVVSELGSAGVTFDLDRVEVSYGGVAVCRQGVAVAHDEATVRAHMAGRALELRCDLGLGPGAAAVLTTDLGYGYIDENRTTS
ncbi:MAG TPA: bifunctional glutamate N-acetyltransferase/amino-acid acetyltransferase ArgJ [Acidimicrobiales bacterium]|nr:bifunctional glutamate N-acetyltransferase/amino-acid acetyltransferase ArgJ [Acidimicrobiales bacterium]